MTIPTTTVELVSTEGTTLQVTVPVSDDPPGHWRGYTTAQLDAAWQAIKNPADWKAPIAVQVRERSVVDLVAATIEFFTGTDPQIEQVRRGHSPLWNITSEGYRNGPAGP